MLPAVCLIEVKFWTPARDSKKQTKAKSKVKWYTDKCLVIY